MTVKYDPVFLDKLKKTDVRIRKSFKVKLVSLIQDPVDSLLNNHPLKKENQGYRSIDITNDWRAVYSEKMENTETIAYFIDIGTHKHFYQKV